MTDFLVFLHIVLATIRATANFARKRLLFMRFLMSTHVTSFIALQTTWAITTFLTDKISCSLVAIRSLPSDRYNNAVLRVVGLTLYFNTVPIKLSYLLFYPWSGLYIAAF